MGPFHLITPAQYNRYQEQEKQIEELRQEVTRVYDKGYDSGKTEGGCQMMESMANSEYALRVLADSFALGGGFAGMANQLKFWAKLRRAEKNTGDAQASPRV